MSSGSPATNPPSGIDSHGAARRTDLLRASPPMFDSPWLDRLSRVHPAVPPAIFAPVIAILLIAALLHWIIHGVHHDHPNDPKRLVMPPSVSVPLAALFLLAFRLVIGGGAA